MNASMFVRAVAHHTTRPDTKELEQAHRHAAAFHEALAEALEAQREIESDDEFEIDRQFWVAKYTTNLGIAAAALQKMPMVWASILGQKLAKVPSPSPSQQGKTE